MLLNCHISANARCLARKVCGLMRSTWGISLGEDKLGASDKIFNTKVARRACARQTFPPKGKFTRINVTFDTAGAKYNKPNVQVSQTQFGSTYPPPPFAEAPPGLSTGTRSDRRFPDHSFYGQKLNRT